MKIRNNLIHRCNKLIELYMEYNDEKHIALYQSIKQILTLDTPLSDLPLDVISDMFSDLGVPKNKIADLYIELFYEEN